MIAPCYQCKARKPGCHSDCAVYNEFLNDYRSKKELMQQERVIERFRIEGAAKHLEKEAKRKPRLRRRIK